MWVDVEKDENQGAMGFFDIEKPAEGGETKRRVPS